MTTSDKDKENGSTENSKEPLEEVKKEEKEDTSSYYSQGDPEPYNAEDEFKKPVPTVEEGREEMSLLKTVAFLAFGLAALAIVFILFFIRDLDSRVGGVDSAVNQLEETIGPLKAEFEENFSKVNRDINGLKTKIGDYEKMMAVLELKRALITINEMSIGNTPEVQAKSDQVISSIELLLQEIGVTASATPGKVPKDRPPGVIKVEEAPKVEEAVPAEPAPVEPSPPKEEAAPVEEAPPETIVEDSVTEETPAEEPATEGEATPAPVKEEESGEEPEESGEEGEAEKEGEEEGNGEEDEEGDEEEAEK